MEEVVVNKSDVIDHVAGAAGVAKQQAESVLDAFFDTVRRAVANGDRVAWPSFGAFSSTDRQARTGRNPRTGEAVAIPASRAVKFSASSALKSSLNPPAKKGGGAKKAAASKPSSTKKSAAPARTAAAPKKAAPAKKAATAAKAPPAKKATAAKATRKR
jgi:DNA-binding protein HU-beta